MQASKSVQKRRKEEAEETLAAKKAKVLRMEMRKRGHVTALAKGSDTVRDAKEKLCTTIATKCAPQQISHACESHDTVMCRLVLLVPLSQ